jgi:hypothetical protein
MKEQKLEGDLKSLPFDPSTCPIDEYTFQIETFSDEIRSFLESYEWLGSVGVSAKWCFTMRLRGVLAGLQVFNEPAAYSKVLGPDTMKMECLVQRGATVSWAHQHLGSKMLMASIRWMVQNTPKRVFIGYSDQLAGEIGIIYQSSNFKYLGHDFGINFKYKHPTYKNGKEFCAHSLRRTSVLKSWCRQNGITVQPSWIKPNGFKDLSVIPDPVKRGWYDWGNQIIKESTRTSVPSKGKYVLVLGRDRREQRYLNSLFTAKTYPYPKRDP